MESLQLIPLPEVIKIAGISKSEIFRRLANKKFPAPVRLGGRCTRWELNEVVSWVSDRLAERNGQKAARSTSNE